MKKGWKKLISLTLTAALMMGTLAGCSGGNDSETGTGTDTAPGTQEGTAMGRYIEEDVVLPEKIGMVIGLVKLNDGTLKMVTSEMGVENSNVCWKSADNGKTWERDTDFPEEIKKSYISSMDLSPDGGAAMAVWSGESGNALVYTLDKDNNLKQLNPKLPEIEMDEESNDQGMELESEGGEIIPETGEDESGAEENQVLFNNNYSNQIHQIKMTNDGKVVGMDYNSNAYLMDPQDGTILKTFEGGKNIQSMFVAGNILGLVGISNQLQLYDIESGETVTDQVLADEILKGNTEFMSSTSVPYLVTAGKDENSIYYCNSRGLYRHVIGGSVSEEVIDGTLSILGSPGTGLQAMQMISDEEFLIAVLDGANELGMESKLIRYTYSKDTPARPSKEINVYALEDNKEIRQAISMFQKANPDYYVNFEIGLTGDDGVTAADALRTLNTNIMAGKGPDILLLDGMPVDAYMEKGLLLDLGDTLGAIAKDEGFFENITNVYTKDGSYFAVPSRFEIPMVHSDKETVQSAKDLTAFTDQIAKLQEQYPDLEKIVSSDAPKRLAEKIYQSYSPAFQNEDGSMNKEKLQEYFTQLKRLNETDKSPKDDRYGWGGDLDPYLTTGIGTFTMEMLMGRTKTDIGAMGSIMNFNMIVSSNDQLEGYEYGLLEAAGKKVFVPRALVGINAKSERIEDAKTFVSYLFGHEAQKVNLGGGFPVNKAAYQELLVPTEMSEAGAVSSVAVATEDGSQDMISLEIRWSSDEEFARLQEMIEAVDTPMLTDSVISEAVLEQAEACMDGSVTPEAAAETVMQKVGLYLSE